MKKKEDIVKVNVVEVLLDEGNTSPIIMYNDDGKEIKFDQIAVIPLEEELYCILKPITKIDGIQDDEAVVFKVIEESESSWLKVECNELIAIRVFNSYYDLIESEELENDKNYILSVIKSDPNLQCVYDEESQKYIDYTKLDIHPFRYQGKLFAIIKENPETNYSEALVWQILTNENEEKRMVWIENDALENTIIKMYLRRQKNA